MKKVLFNVAALTLALATAGVQAKDYEIVNVVKVSGIPWFNQMNKGIEQAADDFGVNARQLGPSTPDPAQQVKIIEDLIAKGLMQLPLFLMTLPFWSQYLRKLAKEGSLS